MNKDNIYDELYVILYTYVVKYETRVDFHFQNWLHNEHGPARLSLFDKEKCYAIYQILPWLSEEEHAIDLCKLRERRRKEYNVPKRI